MILIQKGKLLLRIGNAIAFVQTDTEYEGLTQAGQYSACISTQDLDFPPGKKVPSRDL